MKAVVVGGGLAGITAAVALGKAGHEVTLLEAKPRLGGATMSFNRDGLVIDTGQHVFLRCCTAYRGLLDRLGMTAHAPLQPRFDVTVLAPGKQAALKRRRVPAPLHMLPALLGYPFLNWPERMRLTLAALAFRRLDETDKKADELRLGDWLAAHGQDERTRRVLWDLFSVSSLNVPGDDASLALAAVVVKTGLLGDADAADIGVPTLSLGELHGAAAARLLGKLHATVRTQAKVTAIEPTDDGGFRVRVSGGEADDEHDRVPDTETRAPDATAGSAIGRAAGPSGESGGVVPPGKQGGGSSPRETTALDADAVVLAVPHEQAAKLVPAGALPAETVDGWAGLGAAPIVNVHVIYDRKVMDVPFAAAVDSPVQWVFDRTRISGLHKDGVTSQYLAISLSAADEYAGKPVAELREQFVPALAELFPAAKAATVTEFFVTREKRATFRQVPGTAKLRPKAATGLPGLVLAGSWTDTGWPDTMEGAVRSGLNAVIALHDTIARGARTAAGSRAPQLSPEGSPPRLRPPARPMSETAIVSGAQLSPGGTTPRGAPAGSAIVSGAQRSAGGLDEGTELGTDVPEPGTSSGPPELAENAVPDVSNAEVNMDANEREVRS